MKNSKYPQFLNPISGFAYVALIALPLPAQPPVKKLATEQAFFDKGARLLFVAFWFKHFLGR